MSVSSTKTVAAEGLAGPALKTGSSARAAAMPQVDATGVPFQLEEIGGNRQRRQGESQDNSGRELAQRQRALLNRDFAPLLNRAAAFTATEPSVGAEGGPVIRVFFADLVRGVRSYEYSMRAIAANDRSTGLARGSNYNRYY